MSSYIVKCSSCGTANRVPAEKEGVPGHCGNCRASLPPLYLKPQQVTDSSFDRFIAGYPGPVLAEFWAPW
jgi:thioredoxin 2